MSDLREDVQTHSLTNNHVSVRMRESKESFHCIEDRMVVYSGKGTVVGWILRENDKVGKGMFTENDYGECTTYV